MVKMIAKNQYILRCDILGFRDWNLRSCFDLAPEKRSPCLTVYNQFFREFHDETGKGELHA